MALVRLGTHRTFERQHRRGKKNIGVRRARCVAALSVVSTRSDPPYVQLVPSVWITWWEPGRGILLLRGAGGILLVTLTQAPLVNIMKQPQCA